MRRLLVLILMCGAVLTASSQTPASNYEPGVITAVAPHQTPGHNEADVTQYDVSVRVGNISYVVLYAPPNGLISVRFATGIEKLVLVGSNVLTFNDPAAGTTEVPILSRKTLPPESLNWSKVCGQYFSLKLQHLTEVLTLSDDQQTTVKPILEQEAGEVSQICFNPV
ncbi:MAG: hypothetical protein ACXVKH_13220, partial [Candidatus Angelobacter sp.]